MVHLPDFGQAGKPAVRSAGENCTFFLDPNSLPGPNWGSGLASRTSGPVAMMFAPEFVDQTLASVSELVMLQSLFFHGASRFASAPYSPKNPESRPLPAWTALPHRATPAPRAPSRRGDSARGGQSPAAGRAPHHDKRPAAALQGPALPPGQSNGAGRARYRGRR